MKWIDPNWPSEPLNEFQLSMLSMMADMQHCNALLSEAVAKAEEMTATAFRTLDALDRNIDAAARRSDQH